MVQLSKMEQRKKKKIRIRLFSYVLFCSGFFYYYYFFV